MFETRLVIDRDRFRRAVEAKGLATRSLFRLAVLSLAESARKRLVEKARVLLDRPTEFTLSAFATKLLPGDVAAALVYVRPLQARYLGLEVYGGTRVAGDYATTDDGPLVPGRDAGLDAQGNLPRGYVNDALRDGARWVTLREGQLPALVLPGRGPLKVVAFIVRETHYDARFPFHDIVEKAVFEKGSGAFDRGVRR